MAAGYWATLKGGPFDGYEGHLIVSPPPPRLWTLVAEGCSCGQHVDWFFAWHEGAEVYREEEKDDERRRITYVYEDMATGPEGKIGTTEKTPAPVKPKEPVHA